MKVHRVYKTHQISMAILPKVIVQIHELVSDKKASRYKIYYLLMRNYTLTGNIINLRQAIYTLNISIKKSSFIKTYDYKAKFR